MTAEWKDRKLGDLIKVKHGFAFKGEFFTTEGRYILLTPGNFYESGGFKFTPEKEKYYTGTFPKEYICSINDLIVAMTEQAEGLLGSTALVPCDDLFLHNQRVGLISYDEKKVDKNFLYYLFRIKSVRKQIKGSASGTKVKHTSPERIYAVKVRVPISVTTQKGIAAVLSSLDAKIDLNIRINAELESMTKMLYDFWFVQFDFPDKNGKPYKSGGGRMVWNEELKREIPVGWKDSNILAVAELLGGGTPTKKKPEYWNGSIPFFTPSDADGTVFKFATEDNITEEGLTNSSTKLFEKDTVFITARGSVGKLVLAGTKMAMNQSCYALRAKTGISHTFLYFLTKELIHHLEVKSSGSVFNSIVSNDIEFTNLAIPGSTLIEKFAAIVEPAFDRIANNTRENQHLSSLRDWLLPMLMNGQVEVLG